MIHLEFDKLSFHKPKHQTRFASAHISKKNLTNRNIMKRLYSLEQRFYNAKLYVWHLTATLQAPHNLEKWNLFTDKGPIRTSFTTNTKRPIKVMTRSTFDNLKPPIGNQKRR